MRLHLILAIITAILLALTIRTRERLRFTFAEVQTEAQRLAGQPYVPLPDILPPQLKKLTPAQEQGVFWNDKYRLWRKDGLPFQVDFYPISNEFHTSPRINVVDDHGSRVLAYSPNFFRFNFPIEPPLPNNLGYAGFYIRYPINKHDSLDGCFSVLGASYFRALAKDQIYGLSARGLAINSKRLGVKEEFPVFREWWLVQPGPDASRMEMDALLDSSSVTGAYHFTLRPGAVTSVDVHAVLFFRKSVDSLGIAPFSSMYMYGENAANHFSDRHPEIHDSDGVLMNTGRGDWLWRPLEQEPFLQAYQFHDENPKGFGLLQRDRDFQHYQDLDMKYNVRPSAWVTPHGNWGKGAIILSQAATNNPNQDNVVLSWRPDKMPAAGDRLEIDYTIDFYMSEADHPPLAYAEATWVVNPAPPPPAPAGSPSPSPSPQTGSKAGPNGTTPVQFQIDFTGNGIERLPADKPPILDIHFDPPQTILRDSAIAKIGYDNSWRVTFTIVPFKHNTPTELRCRLLDGNSRPLSETWTYTWHQ